MLIAQLLRLSTTSITIFHYAKPLIRRKIILMYIMRIYGWQGLLHHLNFWNLSIFDKVVVYGDVIVVEFWYLCYGPFQLPAPFQPGALHVCAISTLLCREQTARPFQHQDSIYEIVRVHFIMIEFLRPQKKNICY